MFDEEKTDVEPWCRALGYRIYFAAHKSRGSPE
jgi:hypothetical protein